MESPRPAKRRRVSEVITPISLSPGGSDSDQPNASSATTTSMLNRAIQVLRVEAEALAQVSELYSHDSRARDGLSAAVGAILEAQRREAKLVVCGVGKSSFIAMKLTATLKSLGVSASFLHACEAAHGDLGDLRIKDVLLFVTFSGKTPELLNILPHVPHEVQVMALSSQLEVRDCQVLQRCKNGILLPAPIHESEEVSHGVKAPTTSTTVALAVCDMLALTVADEMHGNGTRDVFARNHPGGAIGLSHQEAKKLKKSEEVDISIVELPSPSISAESSED